MLQLLDATTDYNLTIQWLFYNNGGNQTERYIWATIQLIILLSSQIISMYKMGNVDNIQNNYNDHHKHFDNTDIVHVNQNIISKFDKFMAFIGLGRAWIGSKLISKRETYYPEYSNLKIYELCLESVPSVVLQLYIALVQSFIISNNRNNNKSMVSSLTLMASIIITLLSISFSIWRVFASNVPKDHAKNSNTIHNINPPNNTPYKCKTPVVDETDQDCDQDKQNAPLPRTSVELQLECKPDVKQNSGNGLLVETVKQDDDAKMDGFDVDSNSDAKIVCIDDKCQDEKSVADRQMNNMTFDEPIDIPDVKQKQLIEALQHQYPKYSKLAFFMIYLLILCDLYIRSFPFIFGCFVVRLGYEDVDDDAYKFDFVVSMIMMLFMVVFIGMFEYITLFWIKKEQYKQEYENQVSLTVQETFIAYFTCLLSLFFTLPLRNFHQKNIFSRYAHLKFCPQLQMVELRFALFVCVFALRFRCVMVRRIFMSVVWQCAFFTIWVIYQDSNSNDNIWSLHYIFGCFVIIDLACIYFVKQFDISTNI